MEARNKEIRLKEKTKGILGLGGGGAGKVGGLGAGGGGGIGGFALSAFKGAKLDKDSTSDKADGDKEDPIVKAEREFFAVIKKVRCQEL